MIIIINIITIIILIIIITFIMIIYIIIIIFINIIIIIIIIIIITIVFIIKKMSDRRNSTAFDLCSCYRNLDTILIFIIYLEWKKNISLNDMFKEMCFRSLCGCLKTVSDFLLQLYDPICELRIKFF